MLIGAFKKAVNNKVKGVLASTAIACTIASGAAFAKSPDASQFPWHLYNTGQNGASAGADINVRPIWHRYRGSGCRTHVVEPQDDGNKSHADIVAKLISGPQIGGAPESHSTVHQFDSDNKEAIFKHILGYDVSNHSWAGYYFMAKHENLIPIFAKAAREGRNGLGTLLFMAAGNTSGEGNYGSLQMLPYVMSIGGINRYGKRADTSAAGSFIFAVAPGKHVPTSPGGKTISGTSFASPLAASAGCLMLEANPKLTYRDVQMILATSSRRLTTSTLPFISNAGTSWNGGGMAFNQNFGFGLIDVTAATRLAESWPATKTRKTATNLETVRFKREKPELLRTDEKTGKVSSSITISGQNMRAEWVRIDFRKLSYMLSNGILSGKDVRLELTSPGGTTVTIFRAPSDRHCYSEECNYTQSHHSTTPHFWGEKVNGTWTLTVRNASKMPGNVLTLEDWGITIHGHKASLNNHYIFTDDYARFAAKNTQRQTLNDANGGHDIINLAAMNKGVHIRLDGAQSHIAGTPLNITPDTIEHIIGSAHNDRIIGSVRLNNIFLGGRGNDYMEGKNGQNTYIYRAGDGEDTILPSPSGQDKIEIRGINNPANIGLSRQGNSLKLSFKGGGSITLARWFGPNQRRVQSIALSDPDKRYSISTNLTLQNLAGLKPAHP